MWTEHVNDHTWQRDPYPLTRPRSAPPLLDGFTTEPPGRLLRVLENPPYYPPDPLPGRDPSYGGHSDKFVFPHASVLSHQHMYVHQTAGFYLLLKILPVAPSQLGVGVLFSTYHQIISLITSFVSDTNMATTPQITLQIRIVCCSTYGVEKCTGLRLLWVYRATHRQAIPHVRRMRAYPSIADLHFALTLFF